MKMSLTLAAAAFALVGCNQMDSTLSVKAPETAVAASSGTYYTGPAFNGGQSTNDICVDGALYKKKPNAEGWNESNTGSIPHAQCQPGNQGGDEGGEDGNPTTVVNQPPVAVASVAQASAECSNYGGTFDLDGSASTDDGAIVSYVWTEGDNVVGTGATLSANVLGLGAHTLTLTVTDNGGLTGSAQVVVTVEDNTPPVVSLSVSPGTLWSPNHKYVAISSGATVTDACASNSSDLTVTGSVVSNEADNAKGDGNTSGDIKVTRPNGTVLLSSNAAPVVAYNALTDGLSLRSERAGNKSSRFYSIGFTVTDPSGNAATANGAVVVPHNQ